MREREIGGILDGLRYWLKGKFLIQLPNSRLDRGTH